MLLTKKLLLIVICWNWLGKIPYSWVQCFYLFSFFFFGFYFDQLQESNFRFVRSSCLRHSKCITIFNYFCIWTFLFQISFRNLITIYSGAVQAYAASIESIHCQLITWKVVFKRETYSSKVLWKMLMIFSTMNYNVNTPKEFRLCSDLLLYSMWNIYVYANVILQSTVRTIKLHAQTSTISINMVLMVDHIGYQTLDWTMFGFIQKRK